MADVLPEQPLGPQNTDSASRIALPPPRPALRRSLLVLSVAALAVIFASAVWAFHWADQNRRQDLLMQAQLVAKAIDRQRLTRLSGSPSDLASPDYQRILIQLDHIRTVNPGFHYLYLLGRRPDSGIFFFVEAMPPAEKTPTDVPGLFYAEASDQLRNAFSNGHPFTEGPLPDEWGIWVSALVPLSDPDSGSVLAVLGIDLDARHWNRQIALRAALPVSLVTIAVLLAMAAVFLQESRRILRLRQTELQESEARFAQIAEQSRTFVWEVNAEGLYTHASSVCHLLLGYTPDKLIGHLHFYDLHPPENRSVFMQSVLREFARKEPIANLENPMLTRSGRVIWVATNALPVLNADGSLRGYRGSDMDITPRKLAEERLLQRNLFETKVTDACALLLSPPNTDSGGNRIDSALALLMTAASAHRAFIFENWTDPVEGLCLKQTHEVCADWIPPLSGHPALQRLPYRDICESWGEELSLGHCLQGSPENFPGKGRQFLESLGIASLLAIPIHSGGKWRGFIGFDYVDHARVWDEDGMKLLRTAAEVIGGYLHSAELSATLQAERDRYSRIVELLSDTVWTFEMDAHRRLVDSYISPALDQMLDLPAGTIHHDFLTFFSYVHPDDRQMVKDILMGTPPQTSPQGRVEYRVLASGGNLRWFLSNGSAHLKPNGNLIVYGTTSDITERKRAEHELRETNLRLEESAARARELAREAQEASQAKSRFLMQMSHEIRTPMNAVLGMADLLEESSLNPDQLRFLGILQSAGNHLLGVIDDILDFSKLESHSVHLAEHPFDLHHLAEKCAQFIAVKAMEKAIEVAYSVAPGIPQFILGDEQRLRQVILNLMGNAIKFTDNGSISLVIEPADDHRLRLTVSDTGIGIPPDQLSKIFQRFYQTDLSLSRRYGGTGIGLTITREIVELMGGEIHVASTVGEGSVFTVLLPLRSASPDQVASLASAVSAARSGPTSTPLPPMRLLLAEDLPVNRDMIRFYLQGQPVEITEAVNGREAVEHCARQRFDLVLMDVEMPEMDGLTAMQRIRDAETLSGSPPVPIYALTAHAMADMADKCRGAGAQQVLTKPVRKRTLLDALRHAVQAPPAGGPVPSPPPPVPPPSRLPVDLDRLVREFDGDSALAMQMLHSWLASVPALLDDLRSALGAPDLDQVRRTAHAIKGAAANLSADPLAAAASSLEAAALAADPDGCARRVLALQTACDELSRHVARSHPTPTLEAPA